MSGIYHVTALLGAENDGDQWVPAKQGSVGG
jgi:hypothetical protein